MFKNILESILLIIFLFLELIHGDICSKETLEKVSSPNNEYTITTYLKNCGATTPFIVTATLCAKKTKCKEIYTCEEEKSSYVYWIDNENVFINNKILNIKEDKYNSVYDENYKDKLYKEWNVKYYVFFFKFHIICSIVRINNIGYSKCIGGIYMNELTKEKLTIENMIYEVRGKQVMLASDLAKLYQCINGTKTINQAVKRNIERFPEDFYFHLTETEFNNLRFQFGTANNKARTLPYVFTEQGVAMLATILRTPVAAQVSINIMRAFVEMRKYISTNLIEQRYITTQVLKNTEDIKLLQESFEKLQSNNQTSGIFFEGQIYDAYSLLLDILNTSKESITIIDNYIDKTLLDVLRNTDKQIIIITNKYNNEDFTKYKEQYKNIELKINNTIHDRFIIIDKKTLYHSGASFKDIGKKCFAITKIENEEWLDKLTTEI